MHFYGFGHTEIFRWWLYGIEKFYLLLWFVESQKSLWSKKIVVQTETQKSLSKVDRVYVNPRFWKNVSVVFDKRVQGHFKNIQKKFLGMKLKNLVKTKEDN